MARNDSMKIFRNDLRDPSPSQRARIEGLQHLSSYNWIDAPTPVIAVPGIPALWSPPIASRQLPKDSGLVYINQNAARHPDSPLEPLFRALYISRPSFDVRPIDVVTDRNNVRKLLSFVTAESSKERPESFMVSVEMVKNTAIFCRDDTLTQEYIGLDEFRGYGHEFEKAYTKPQITCSTGHHRIISYRFCDITFLVRHETDGYFGPVANSSPIDGARTEDDDFLSSKLGSMSISTINDTSCLTPAGSRLTVKRQGHEVPLSTTIEIKTRAAHKVLHVEDVAPQLWISQTPKLVRAYHRKGVFEVPLVKDVSDKIKLWELNNQEHLQSLASLIRKILGFAKQCGGKAVVAYDQVSDTLVLRKAERENLLPKDIYRHWTELKDPGEEIADSISLEQTEPDIVQPSRTIITIGDTKHSIDISQIPYLSSFVAFQTKAQPNNAEFTHSPIPFFDVALKCLELGYRHCFRNIPADLSQHHALCDTYEFLGVDVLGGRTLDELVEDLKAGKSGYELEYKYYTSTRGDKTKARDAAFKFLYFLLLGEFHDELKASMKVYNAVLFIVSHPATFRPRTRVVIKLAYEERFISTKKQRAILDKWDKKFIHYGQDEEDVTTSEESDYIDSDFSF